MTRPTNDRTTRRRGTGRPGPFSEPADILFRIWADWRRAKAPPTNALRWMLKMLLRMFNARCYRCDVERLPPGGGKVQR